MVIKSTPDRNFNIYEDSAKAIRTTLVNSSGNTNSSNYPICVDGDSVYEKDLDLTMSDSGTFTGNIEELFNNYSSTVSLADVTTTNPKSFTLRFKRPLSTDQVGMASPTGGTFSNVRMSYKDLSGTIRFLLDNSSDDKDRTSFVFQFPPITFIELFIEFLTPDAISLAGMFIPKNGTVDIVRLEYNPLFVNRHFVRELGVVTNPTNPVTAGDQTITVASTVGFSTGDSVFIRENPVQDCDIFQITNIAGSVITLSRPICNNYSTTTDFILVSENMAVDGSVTPISFRIQPPAERIWNIERIIIGMKTEGEPDDSTFGDIASLTNGVIVREVINGSIRTLAQWRDNSDIAQDMFDVTFTSASRLGQYGVRGRWTFTKFSHEVILNGNNGDYIEVIIQDDLESNQTQNQINEFEIKGQGHVNGNL